MTALILKWVRPAPRLGLSWEGPAGAEPPAGSPDDQIDDSSAIYRPDESRGALLRALTPAIEIVASEDGEQAIPINSFQNALLLINGLMQSTSSYAVSDSILLIPATSLVMAGDRLQAIPI